MDLLTQTLGKLNINDEHYSGENVSNETDFLEKPKKRLRKALVCLIVAFIMEK